MLAERRSTARGSRSRRAVLAIQNHAELAAACCFVFLVLAAGVSGIRRVDAARGT
jgi:hypothetical protein